MAKQVNEDTELQTIKSITLPPWIEDDLTVGQVEAINQGGCASGAYMPAVIYHTALQTMSDHGDDALEYIENQLGELPAVPKQTSWSGIACFYLSLAVELYASSIEQELKQLTRGEE